MRISEAAARLNVPARHIQYWKKTGLVGQKGTDLEFQDLLRIRFIRDCRSKNIPLSRIRSVLHSVQQESPGEDLDQAFQALDIYSPGILVQRDGDGHMLLPRSGQYMLDLFSRDRSGASQQGRGQKDNGAGDPGDQNVVEFASRSSSGNTGSSGPGDLEELEQKYFRALESESPNVLKKILKEILDRYPEHPGALIEMGNLLFEQERVDESLSYYEKVLEVDPSSAEAIYNIANIYFGQKKFAAAIRYFEQCIHIDPDFPEPYYNLGIVYLGIGHLDHARHFLQSYLHLDPDSIWSDQASQHLEEIESTARGGGASAPEDADGMLFSSE